MSKHEAALLDEMRAFAGRVVADQRQPQHVLDAAADVLISTGLTGTMAAMVPLILAAEDAAARADAVTAEGRSTLLRVLDSTTGAIRSGPHQALVARGKPGATVTDQAAIPAAFLRTSPDMRAITAALTKGETVPGAALKNGAPHLTIRTDRGAT